MRFRPDLITFAVAVAVSSQAQAALQIDTSLVGSISSTGPAIADTTMSDPGSIPPGQTYISAYEFTGGYPSTGFFGERLSGNTIVRAVTNNDSYGTVTSQLEYRATVTNNGSSAMPLSFLWHIGRGRVSVSGTSEQWLWVGIDEETGNDIYDVIRPDFEGSARLQSTISWGGTSVWSVDLLTTNSDETGVSKSITKSASAAGFNTYDDWSGGIGYDEYSGNLGLGMLGVGESKELVYTITGTVWYTDNTGCNECFYGYGGAVVGNTDPFQFEYDEVGRFGPGGVIATPEPSTWAAMAVGLMGIGAMARRRRKVALGLC
jgi:hypothetical protein